MVGMTVPDSPFTSAERQLVKVADQSFETNGAGEQSSRHCLQWMRD
jgi:hypothetical protein